jgi:hypothetical protein
MLLHLIYFANLKTLCYFIKQILLIISTKKKPATIEEAGEVLHIIQVEQRGGKSKHFDGDLISM